MLSKRNEVGRLLCHCESILLAGDGVILSMFHVDFQSEDSKSTL